MSDIPPLKLPTRRHCTNIQKINRRRLLSCPQGLLRPPGTFSSRLDPCPAYDVFCLGVVEDFVGEGPGGDGPLHRKVLGVAYRPAVDPAQVLPICQLAARVLTVSDLRMACLVSH